MMRAVGWRTGLLGIAAILLLATTEAVRASGTPTPALGLPGAQSGLAPGATADEGPSFVPGELIVKMRGNASPSDLATVRDALASSANGQVNRLFPVLPDAATLAGRFPVRSARVSEASRARAEASLDGLRRIFKIRFNPEIAPQKLAVELRREPNVEYAEPNFLARLTYVPDDPFYSSSGSWGQDYDDLWGLKSIRTEGAWDLANGSGVLVAVSDTGVDLTHPELVPRLWTNAGEILNGEDDDGNGFIDDLHGWNFVDDNNNLLDDHGHGTHVSGTIAAEDNSIGVIGVAFGARILPVRAFDAHGNGTFEDGAASIVYATLKGADVVNMSWGGMYESDVLQDAVALAHGCGVILVAAAGNDGLDLAGFHPAAYPEVIAVAALDHNDGLASFSNWGSLLSVAAPGGDSTIPDDPLLTYNNILSLKSSAATYMDNPVLVVDELYYRARGTSMASPHASGVAALILSRQPSLGNDLARVVLEASAEDLGEPGFDIVTGHGKVDAYEAMLLADTALDRAELVASISSDTKFAAPGSPVAATVRVENLGPVAAANVSMQVTDGDPQAGGQVLHAWTVPSIAAGGVYQTVLRLALASPGERDVFVLADAAQQILEVSEENNKRSTRVNVMAYQYVERVVADDEGLAPIDCFVEQRNPSISGDRVVWLDNRDATELYPSSTEVYLLDLSTGIETRITSFPSVKSDPRISGDRIVWIDRRNGYYDLYLYDLSTGVESRITSDTYSRSYPRIHGDWIVWADSRNGNADVFAYNVGTGGPELRLTTDPDSQSMPVVYGDRVVWLDSRDGESACYSYVLPEGPETAIVTGPGSRFGCDIDVDTVVWAEGYFNSMLDMNFGIYQLEIGQPSPVQLTSSPAVGDMYPSISSSDIAWTRGIFRANVVVMDRETGYETALTSTGTSTYNALDAGDGRVVWEEYRRMVWSVNYPCYDYNIYLAERDPFPAVPRSLDATNGGSGTINLDWADNSESDLAGYNVYRRLSSQGPYTFVATTTKSSYTDTGLTNGIPYYYRVSALDAAGGESGLSNEDYAIPKILTGGSPVFRKPIPQQLP